jgi:2-keto-3-deoxy-L-rhamnonate aldolase RhmA
MNYYYITNCPKIAKLAINANIQRIFLDCEVIGKHQRQGHLDTLISNHSLSNLAPLKNIISNAAEILVRLNPVHNNSKCEIEKAIEGGADIIMLPMFRSLDEVNIFIKFINKRAKFIPLVETREAFSLLKELCKISEIDEIFIGLNDLTIDLKMQFIFEPMLHGMLDNAAKLFHEYDKPFGFGGISRIGDGIIPAEKVLGEHIRLGSTSVILSRAFHNNSSTYDELIKQINLQQEIAKLNHMKNLLFHRNENTIEHDKINFNNLVLDVLNSRIKKHEKIS